MTASRFIIRELTGDARTIELTERALPERGFELSGVQRAEFSWYAGAATASVQVLGPEEEPTEIRGRWTNQFIGRGVAFGESPMAVVDGIVVADVRELVELFDDVRRKGQLLEVVWDAQARHGLLVRFLHRWQQAEVVEWEARFQWASQAEPEHAPVFSPSPSLGAALGGLGLPNLGALLAGLDGVAEFFEFVAAVQAGLQMARAFLDGILGAIALVTEAIIAPLDLVTSIISLAQAFVTSIEEAIANAIAKFEAAIQRLVDTVSADEQSAAGGSAAGLDSLQAATPGAASGAAGAYTSGIGGTDGVASYQSSATPEKKPFYDADFAKQSNKGAASPASTGGLVLTAKSPAPGTRQGRRIAAVGKATRVLRELRRVRGGARQIIVEMERRLQRQGIIAVYTARRDDDLRAVSLRYFGTQNQWREIMKFNHLDGSALDVGRVILVPALQAGV